MNSKLKESDFIERDHQDNLKMITFYQYLGVVSPNYYFERDRQSTYGLLDHLTRSKETRKELSRCATKRKRNGYV